MDADGKNKHAAMQEQDTISPEFSSNARCAHNSFRLEAPVVSRNLPLFFVQILVYFPKCLANTQLRIWVPEFEGARIFGYSDCVDPCISLESSRCRHLIL